MKVGFQWRGHSVYKFSYLL